MFEALGGSQVRGGSGTGSTTHTPRGLDALCVSYIAAGGWKVLDCVACQCCCLLTRGPLL